MLIGAPKRARGEPQGGPEASVKLEAAAIAAGAEVAQGIEGDVPELAGAAGKARQHAAVDDDRAADADVDLEEEKIIAADGGAPQHLGDRRAIALVVGEDRQIERRRKGAQDVRSRPGRHHARAQHPARFGMDRAGHGDAGADQRGARHARLGADRLDEPARRLGRRLRRIVQRHVDRLVGENGVRDVGGDDADVGRADRHADAGAGARIERHRRSGPPRARIAPRALGRGVDHDARAPELGEDARHRRFGESARARDLRRAEAAALAQQPDDAARGVVLAFLLEKRLKVVRRHVWQSRTLPFPPSSFPPKRE